MTLDVLRFDNWDRAKDNLTLFPRGWLFRGQRDADWPLQTTLERTDTQLDRVDAEQFALQQFQSRALRFLRMVEVPTSTLEWLALMQHHGAPTRLLDFTSSPYVVAFFALEEPNPSGSVSTT